MRVWIVGQVKEDGWDLGGVFSTEERARAACSEPGDCYWPVEMDEAFGRETVQPPGLVFPVAA